MRSLSATVFPREPFRYLLYLCTSASIRFATGPRKTAASYVLRGSPEKSCFNTARIRHAGAHASFNFADAAATARFRGIRLSAAREGSRVIK